jgi:DNA primase large subunit
VTPADLDMVSKVSMPLCMRTLHEALRSNHHLK